MAFCGTTEAVPCYKAGLKSSARIVANPDRAPFGWMSSSEWQVSKDRFCRG
jgi:hypothetical protein